MLNTHDLPDDVADLKRLVREHRLEIEHLKLQLSRLRRWKYGRSREQLELEVAQLQMSLQAVEEIARATGLAGPSRRLIAARGFLSYLRACGHDVEVPSAGLLAAAKGRRPYLYSAEQIADLLKAALALGPKRLAATTYLSDATWTDGEHRDSCRRGDST